MNVMQRNFIRLLSSGTFGNREPLEAMSSHKWRQLFQLSLMHGVAALVYDGIQASGEDFHARLPVGLHGIWHDAVAKIENDNREKNMHLSMLFEQMTHKRLRPILLKGQSMAVFYPNPLHRTSGHIDVYLPYENQSQTAAEWLRETSSADEMHEKGVTRFMWQNMPVEHHRQMQRLTNPLLNRKLQNIINREIRCCDSYYIVINGTRIEGVPPTLNLLLLITRIVRFMINEGIALKQLVDLGMFLRTIGDKVDYVQLQSHLKKLGMQDAANIIGNIMMRIFAFEADELPFVTKMSPLPGTNLIEEVFSMRHHYPDEWYFTQGKHIFVRNNNSSAMLWHIRHSAKFMRYYPAEVFTSFFTSFAHSLSHIEE